MVLFFRIIVPQVVSAMEGILGNVHRELDPLGGIPASNVGLRSAAAIGALRVWAL